MEATGAGYSSGGVTVMWWSALRAAITKRAPWNPDDDATIRYLRQQRALSERRAQFLREHRPSQFPTVSFIRGERYPNGGR